MSEQLHSEMSAFRGRGSLGDLVRELHRQRESRVDFITDVRSLTVRNVDGQLRVCPRDPQTNEWLPTEGVTVRDQALVQIGAKMSPHTPGKFLKELKAQHPEIAADLIYQLWQGNGEQRRMMRCLDGKLRAFLSDSFLIMDNLDLGFAALETAKEVGGEVLECNLTESNMRIKFTSRQVWDAVEEGRSGPSSNWYAGGMGNQDHLGRVGARTGGDLPGGPGTVHPLVTISNSETGHGGLHVRIGLLKAICFNLATVETVVKRAHLGPKLDAETFSPETIAKNAEVVLMAARDGIRKAFDREWFKKVVAKAQKAQDHRIEAPTSAVNNIVEANGLSEAAKDSILEHFLMDYDKTAYGLAQAVSRSAQDFVDADTSTELEDLAGAIVARPTMVAVS